jgi:DNA-3-methyladenine glycosylase II
VLDDRNCAAVSATREQAILNRGGPMQSVHEEQTDDQQDEDDNDPEQARTLAVGCRLFFPLVDQGSMRIQLILPPCFARCSQQQNRAPGAQVKRELATQDFTMSRKAMQHLSMDAQFGALIRRVGPPRLQIQTKRSPYEALVRAIAHQQLHGRAAEAILARFGLLFPDAAFPTPDLVLAQSEERLRACGFSGSKIVAIRDICAKAIDGTIPSRTQSARLDNEALIERLTCIRGVGRWTVEMLLIFTLGRMDVLPVDDFGVREGYRVLYGLDAQPKPRALAEIGLAWAPYRSHATWYLYRSAEEGRGGERSRA